MGAGGIVSLGPSTVRADMGVTYVMRSKSRSADASLRATCIPHRSELLLTQENNMGPRLTWRTFIAWMVLVNFTMWFLLYGQYR